MGKTEVRRGITSWAPELAAAVYRANPGYDLVLLDRLAPGERAAVVAEEAEIDDVYGILRPRESSGLEVRSVSFDTALLVLTLATPGPLPSYVRAQLGAGTDHTVARLVTDGILEVSRGDGFVSGPAADGLLGDPARDAAGTGGAGRIGDLSIAALRHGQELGDLPIDDLAMRLYTFGRHPLAPSVAVRLADEGAIGAHLGITRGGAHAALEASWVEVPPPAGWLTAWRQWRARPAPRAGGTRPGASYKLYVSPAFDAVGSAVAAVAGTLVRQRGVTAFKVGRTAPDLCRPDKLVVYFDRLDDLQEAAATLEDHLAGCPAQGVPFSAAITPDGLLSWGADPPARPVPRPTGADEADGAGDTRPSHVAASWRVWVTEQLAAYLRQAMRSNDDGPAPWQFALHRLRLAGIDTDTWVPTDGTWPEALVSA